MFLRKKYVLILLIFFIFFFFVAILIKNYFFNYLSIKSLKTLNKVSNFRTYGVKNKLDESSFFNFVSTKSASKANINPNEYVIIATGDVIPARSVNWKLTGLNNFNYPFEKTQSLLKSADILLVNLESPLISDCKTTVEGMIFCGNQKFAKSMANMKVKVANLANNHTTNYGIDGINQTVEILKQNNITVEGLGAPSIINIKGRTFGFLGFNDIGVSPLVASADAVFIDRDIKELKKTTDFVIVSFHWGIEYTSTPSARQIQIAHSAIDAGADLIIGNHPHWPQGVEIYKDKLITYAHGNFIFDQMWSWETREGVVGKYTFNNQGLSRVEFIPIIIDDYSQPRFATKMEATSILSKMKASTNAIKQIVGN